MGQRQHVTTGAPWEDIVGYARAVRIGSVIEVSGTTAVDENGAVVGMGDPAVQTRYILNKIQRALEQLGAGMQDVVRTRIYVIDIAQWEAIGRVHGEYFASIKPAATMVEVNALISPELLVEIEVTAIVGQG